MIKCPLGYTRELSFTCGDMQVEQHQLLNPQLRALGDRGGLRCEARWEDVGDSNSIYKLFVWLACGRHVLYTTKAALLANPESFQCPTCNCVWVYKKCDRARQVGVREERLWRMLLMGKEGLAWWLQDRIKGAT